jgi:ABC-type multidrug transport system fused ATPase/permease subunit
MTTFINAFKDYPKIFIPTGVTSLVLGLLSIFFTFLRDYNRNSGENVISHIANLTMGSIYGNLISIYTLITTNLIILVFIMIILLWIIKRKARWLYDIFEKMNNNGSKVTDVIRDGYGMAKKVVNEISGGIDMVKDGVDTAIDTANSVIDSIKDLIDDIADFGSDVADGVVNTGNTVGNVVNSAGIPRFW